MRVASAADAPAKPEPASSARREELLGRAYEYVLANGVADVSLRPLAAAIGSSPRVILFLFGSKDGLMRALMERAREQELELIERVRASDAEGGILVVAAALWGWLATPAHRPLLRIWVERYGSSLAGVEGPWTGFAERTVEDWLELLAAAQPAAQSRTAEAETERTLVLAVLRGALLDLLATGDRRRTTAAIRRQLELLGGQRRSRPPGPAAGRPR
jgi:AcrR family transcriptional regulator